MTVQNHFPSTITSPTQQFQRVRFIIEPEKGTLVIRARSGKILKETSGTVTPTETGWLLVNEEGTWTLTRDKGCGCGGSKVLELQA